MGAEHIYYDDPLRSEWTARVVSVRDGGVVLDRTAAYPEGGGQPGDRGLIGGLPFSDTVHSGDEILHITPSPGGLKPGDLVQCSLDWTWRLDHMRMHTAQHMASGTLFKFWGIGTKSVHFGEETFTIELDRPEVEKSVLLELEDKLNGFVRDNREVKCRVLPHSEAEALGLRRSIKVEGDVRIVEIDGVDTIACGGVHVPRTGMVGEMAYAGSESIRGHLRTIWRCGRQAVGWRRANAEIVSRLGALLSATPETIEGSVTKLIDDNKAAKAESRALSERIAALELGAYGPVFESSVPVQGYQKLCSAERMFFAAHDEGGRSTWIFSGGESQWEQVKRRICPIGAKGGGRPPMWQGSAPVPAKTLVESVLG